ncbi:hypothetical protein GQR58_021185 [Nymphon striatum]|nr:hypothetical protein GQR58_021185 [Nymphon striatum]
MSELKARIFDDMKTAMRAKEKDLLMTVRTILAAIKQQEVDTREDLNDTDVLAILDKLSKQRRESINQFKEAGRDDLVAQEEMELGFIQRYLPEPLSDDEVQSLVAEAIASSGAESMKEMGKVMAILKPQVQGRADMGKISGIIKSALTG